MLTKSKLNSIEPLISQALIVMEISHEEFITILKEKDKYEKMKECEIKDLSEKLLSILCHQKKLIFFLCMYKMFKITAETFTENGVQTIKVNKTDKK